MRHMTDDTIRALMEAATPGPWKSEHMGTKSDLQRGLDLCFIRQPTECGDDPALARTHRSGRSTQEMVDNARLIAAAPDLAAECLARGAERDAALARGCLWKAQAEYDRGLIVDIRVALLKSQEAIIPTETLKRWVIAMGDWDNGGVAAYDELTAIIAERERG